MTEKIQDRKLSNSFCEAIHENIAVISVFEN